MNLEHLVIDNIKRIRKERGISQEKLAEYCNTSASYIGLMETYKNVPKLSTIEKIAAALNVSPIIFFTDQDSNLSFSDLDLRNRLKNEILNSLSNDLDQILKQI